MEIVVFNAEGGIAERVDLVLAVAAVFSSQSALFICAMFLKILRKSPKVILTTAYREHALDAFELDAIDYLLKPIELHRFIRAVNKVKELFETNQKEKLTKGLQETSPPYKNILIKSGKKLYKVPFDDIYFIKSESEYITYQTKSFGKLMVHGALKEVENTLPQNQFLRIHRSYIVNVSHIKYVEANVVFIETFFSQLVRLIEKHFLINGNSELSNDLISHISKSRWHTSYCWLGFVIRHLFIARLRRVG